MAKHVKILEDEIFSRDRALAVLAAHTSMLVATGADESFFVKVEGGQNGSPYRIVLYKY